ncbi:MULTISPECIES: efflux RND transporter periplasmic adaptor subunit [Aeribacillus]|uniref:efflux RND transporter periplasmic adaptor subunit n=1 Tax=Aeribacillus TaxID=1055323 RepID=UPI001023DC0E|nr:MULTISPECIES: efflux RND transporter periplasmic adaptor subunit [Aeribacillus]MED0701895.1 efflux RND transporter periplasmic adaptor subunit [Aeribacillus composti]MED0716881.1 efflux RND transporter periplasmic adaptor subunit [Aeribacillus composti]MED0746737.1 efflux RND transporter periplasmic adaptor subunit [Aeribacillus composti]RZI50937.1 efflux RND transporter periplasmic adaptor subunit [Aeribacillus pallidus]TVZ76826.1 HlyD family secretion protein [Aeribacillus composti]
MRKKVLIGVGVAVIIALFVGISIFRAASKENPTVETVKLEQKEITGNVMIPGTLQLMNEQKIYYDAERGKIKKILVKEGDKIKKGAPLVIYENEQLELEKEQAKLSIEQSYIKLDQINEQLDDLKKKEEELKKQVGKEEAEKQIENEKNQLQMDKKMTNLELKQQKIQLETVEKKILELEVKSEVDGIVITVDEDAAVAMGENVKPIIHIGSLNKMKVEGVISEYDSLKIKEGQPVVLKSDVVPDAKWKGKVLKIGILPQQGSEMAAETGNEAVQYPVEVLVQDQNIPVKPGFKLIMEIETERKKANVIPLTAVKQDDDQQYVYVVKNGKITRKEIKTGTSTDEYIEVTSGLTKDDEIVREPSDEIKAGVEVTIK